MKQIKILIIIILVSLALLSCVRSQGYRRDQDYYREDSEYYSRKFSNQASMKQSQLKKKIYVFLFMNDTSFGGDDLSRFATDELLRILRSSGRAIVPDDLHVSVNSQDFYEESKVKLGSLSREAKKLGLSLAVIGKIRKITYRKKGDDVGLLRKRKSLASTVVEARVFDVIEPRELLIDEKTADSSSNQLMLFGNQPSDDQKLERLEVIQDSVRNGVRLLASGILRALDKLGWQGQIAKLSGNQIYINAGRSSGLNIGDILKVVTQGEEVYDPSTGAFLGKTEGKVKGTLEIVDYLGSDGAVATVHSGGNFLENDIVQLY